MALTALEAWQKLGGGSGYHLLSLLSYLGRVLQLVHGRILDALPGGSLGGLHQVSQGGSHVFHCIDEHHLQ